MASSRKKRSRAVVTLLLCLAAVCIVAALVLYGLANRKLKALQQGADFEFTYAVTSQGGTTHPALYSILDQAGATEGRMTGLYSPGQLQLYLYSRDAATTETSGDNFFTDVYIDADQTLFNAGKLYRTLRDSVVSSYPLVGTFFPEWSLPNYVSQAQLAQMLGVPDSQVAMQDMSGYTLKLDPKWIVHPDYDPQGFTYFQFPSEGVGSPTLVLGLPLKSLLFDDSIPVDILSRALWPLLSTASRPPQISFRTATLPRSSSCGRRWNRSRSSSRALSTPSNKHTRQNGRFPSKWGHLPFFFITLF